MMKYDELKALIEKRGVHPEFGEPGENFGIEQNPHELAVFLVRMQELDVQSMLEIGTGHRGGLSRFIAQDLHWDVTTVDIQNYGHVFTGVHYVIGKDAKFDSQFDLVFIDGDHSYDAVKWDYAIYMNLTSKAIAFHDILGKRDCEGVKMFWSECQLSPLGRYMKHYQVQAPVNASGIGWIEL